MGGAHFLCLVGAPSYARRMNDSRPTLDVQEHSGIGLVAVSGDMTVYEATELRDVLRATTSHNKVTLVDLSQTTFMDATALGVLVGALKAANEAGTRLELIAPDGDGHIRKVLRITGLGKMFTLHVTASAALNQHGVRPPN